MVSENLKTLIFFLILLPFFLFQLSVIAFVISAKLKKNPFYSSSFFTLFVMVTIVDTVAEVDVFMCLQLIAVDFLEFMYLESEAFVSILYQLSSYTLFTQCYIHIGIAINRVWIAYTTTKSGGRYWGSAGKLGIYLLPFITIPFIIPRYWFNAYVFRDATGRLYPGYNTSIPVKTFISGYSTTLCFAAAVICFLLQIATIIQYRILLTSVTKAGKKQIYQEIRLLGQAAIVLLTQMLATCIQLFRVLSDILQAPYFTQLANEHHLWVQNVTNLSGPIALMLVASRIRKDYLDFVFRRTPATTVASVVSVTQNSQNPSANKSMNKIST